MEKKLKEKEIEKKPEAIEEMKKLLEEKDLKIQELKQQLVVSSSNESFVAETEDIVRFTWPFHENYLNILFYRHLSGHNVVWHGVEMF